jgi:hypothetical protein
MTPPLWLRWLTLPFDLVIGIPLMLIGTVVFLARRADDRLAPRPILQRVGRLSWAIAVVGVAYLIVPSLAIVFAAGWAWQLGRAGALKPRSGTAEAQPPIANISIRGSSAVASVRRSE